MADDLQKIPHRARRNKSGPSGLIYVNESGHARVGPTDERLAQARLAGDETVQQVETEVKDENRDVVRVATTTRLIDGDVLALLAARHVIDAEQFACGREYYRHWSGSGLSASGVPDLLTPRVDGGQFKPESEQRLGHLVKFMSMVRRLGEVHNRVLTSCLLAGESLLNHGLRRGPYRNEKQAKEWAQGRLVAALEQLVINEIGSTRPARPKG